MSWSVRSYGSRGRDAMPSTFGEWSEYLSKARNGHDRPIGGSATKRVMWGPDHGTIHLRLHATDCVILYPDGSQVIDTGGWNTMTTRAFLNEHSAASVQSVQNQLIVATADPTITPPKVRKCRACKGVGSTPRTCNGPGWQGFRCHGRRPHWTERPGQVGCEHGKVTRHIVACRHGQLAPHADGRTPCYRCDSTGQCDYGSHAIHYQWDGRPLSVDSDGEPIGPPSYVPRASAGERVTRSRPPTVWERYTPGPSYVRACDRSDEITPTLPDGPAMEGHRYASHGGYADDLAANPITDGPADPYAPSLLDRIDALIGGA